MTGGSGKGSPINTMATNSAAGSVLRVRYNSSTLENGEVERDKGTAKEGSSSMRDARRGSAKKFDANSVSDGI